MNNRIGNYNLRRINAALYNTIGKFTYQLFLRVYLFYIIKIKISYDRSIKCIDAKVYKKDGRR